MNYEEGEEEEGTAQTYTAKPNRETNQTNSSTTYKNKRMLLQHFVTKRERGAQIFLNFNNVLSFAFVNPPLLLY